MSLLQRAKDAGEDAKVISVLGWMESSTWMILGYRSDSPCTVVAAAAYHDLAIESFAAQPPDIAFAHIYQAIIRRGDAEDKIWPSTLTRRYMAIHTLSPFS